MKAKTAQWKMKESLKKWGMSLEFWQDTLVILREFEKEIRKEYESEDKNNE